jgi:hypothetical protein
LQRCCAYTDAELALLALASGTDDAVCFISGTSAVFSFLELLQDAEDEAAGRGSSSTTRKKRKNADGSAGGHGSAAEATLQVLAYIPPPTCNSVHTGRHCCLAVPCVGHDRLTHIIIIIMIANWLATWLPLAMLLGCHSPHDC